MNAKTVAKLLTAGTVLCAALAAAAPGPLPVAADPAPSREWRPWARAPKTISETAVVSLDGNAYFLGGVEMTGPVDSVYALDLRTRSWTRRAPMPVTVTMAAVAPMNGRVYVAGGCVRGDGSFPTAEAEAYDPATDAWTRLPPLPERLCSPIGAALHGRFYVFGGLTGGFANENMSTRVYAFDPRSGKWSRKHDMPLRRMSPAGAELDGRFLLIGGCSERANGYCRTIETSVDAYEPNLDSWAIAPPLPVPVFGGGATLVGGRVVLAGGLSAQNGPESVVFDRTYFLAPADTPWQEGPKVVRPRWSPSLFPLEKGVGMFGSSAANNTEDIVEALGAPGPFIEERKPRAPFVAPPVAAAPPSAPPAAADEDVLPPARPPRPHAYAVVVGVERYRETLPRADYAEADARLTAEYFKRVLGVPEENLALLVNDRATKSDFEKYFERWLPNRVEPGDEVYVYFSGHGAPDARNGDSYLVPFDADPTYIAETGYPIKRLYAQLAKLPAKRVLLAMDSCFSGAGGRSVIAKGARPLVVNVKDAVPRGITVITASSGEQISNTYEEKKHGLFTYFFLEGLRSKGDDFRGVYDALRPRVSRIARRDYNSDQDPQFMPGAKE